MQGTFFAMHPKYWKKIEIMCRHFMLSIFNPSATVSNLLVAPPPSVQVRIRRNVILDKLLLKRITNVFNSNLVSGRDLQCATEVI